MDKVTEANYKALLKFLAEQNVVRRGAVLRESEVLMAAYEYLDWLKGKR